MRDWLCNKSGNVIYLMMRLAEHRTMAGFRAGDFLVEWFWEYVVIPKIEKLLHLHYRIFYGEWP